MMNNSSFVNNSPPAVWSGFAHDPTALQLYVVGKTGVALTLANNAAFYGTVYAPTSTLAVANNAGTWGSVAAHDVSLSPNAIPTLQVVDDTFTKYRDVMSAIIDKAKQRAGIT